MGVQLQVHLVGLVEAEAVVQDTEHQLLGVEMQPNLVNQESLELMVSETVVVVQVVVDPKREPVVAAVLVAAAVMATTTVVAAVAMEEIFQIVLVVLEILFLVGIVVNMQEEEMVAVDLNLRGTGRPPTRLRYKVMEEELVNQALFS